MIQRVGALPGAFRRFLAGEAAGGMVLLAAAAAALLLVNLSPAGAHAYHAALSAPVGPMRVHGAIDEGLMALFFLLVGLEIKREWIGGELASWPSRRLPLIAAGAGMALPAIVYLAVARGHADIAAGWAIPAATDIAFAVGILALLGDRVPPSLKLLLAAVAIVDDMGAVAIIALAYTPHLSFAALAAAAVLWAGLFALNRMGVTALAPYLAGFALLWVALFQSGVHATVAGVAAATAVPIRAEEATSPLHRLESRLHPWSAYAIVPLFGFANAGVALPPELGRALLAPLPLGIAAGLFLGKQAGIFAAVRLAAASGIAALPTGATWAQVHGLAMLCGIGFTMSLFIGGLAFPGDAARLDTVRIGVLAGSLLSAVAGYARLRWSGSGTGRAAA